MDEVIDEELRVGHEVVNGVAGFWFLPTLVQRTTECFHHSHLPRGGKIKEGGHKKNERESGIKKGINERRETQMDRLVSSSRQITDRQTDKTRDTQNQVAEVRG